MIEFRGVMYNATTSQYIDQTPKTFSFAKYINSLNIIQITDQGQSLTTVPQSEFDLDSPLTNVGWMIEKYAKEYYYNHNVWPELWLCSSDSLSTDLLIWNHSNPTNLTIKANGNTIIWRHCLQWSDTIDTSTSYYPFNYVGSYIFVSVDTKNDLLNTPIVWSGSCCGDRNDSSLWYTSVSYIDLSISVNDSDYIVSPNQLIGVLDVKGNGRELRYCTFVGDGTEFACMFETTGFVGIFHLVPCLNNVAIPPYMIDLHWTGSIDVYDTSFTAFTTYNGVQWGGNSEYACSKYYPVRYESDFPMINLGSLPTSSEQMDYILNILQPTYTYIHTILYYYLCGVFGEMPNTNVDPDNIPPTVGPITPVYPDSPDPYLDPEIPEKAPSTTGGGDADPPQTPESVVPGSTPPSHAINSKFLTIYIPTLAQLNSLAEYLWSPSWTIDAFKKIFANPIDCILGLMVFPALTYPSSTKNLNVGNLDTGVSMNYTTNQFVDLNCGTFTLKEFYGSYLDYSPYTKVQIYLPYIGMRTLSPDDIMEKEMTLLYRIDLLSSACVAFIEVDGTTLYTFSGSCGTSIPISGSNWSNMLNGIIGVGGAAVAVAATGGASAIPIAAGMSSASSLAVASIKPEIQRSGSVMSAAGLMGIQIPYLIVTRPRQSVAQNQNSFTGYPSNITMNLSACTGFTQVEEVHLDGIPATQEELAEIENLLKGGVYV